MEKKKVRLNSQILFIARRKCVIKVNGDRNRDISIGIARTHIPSLEYILRELSF